MNEGVMRRFQSITIAVGDCVHEDMGLSTVIATPGLRNVSIFSLLHHRGFWIYFSYSSFKTV